jgi:hypothetical protein
METPRNVQPLSNRHWTANGFTPAPVHGTWVSLPSGLQTANLPGTQTKFFRDDGTWDIPPTVTASNPGYTPTLANTGSKFIRDDGTWNTPPQSLPQHQGDPVGSVVCMPSPPPQHTTWRLEDLLRVIRTRFTPEFSLTLARWTSLRYKPDP